MISCLVDKDGDTLNSQPHLESSCLKYEFDLGKRTPYRLGNSKAPFVVKKYHDQAAINYFDEHMGTPEKLMIFLKSNYLPKDELAELFSREAREYYLETCSHFERLVTEYCCSKVSERCPEFEGDCPFEKEGTCNEARNRNIHFHDKVCIKLCLDLFRYPNFRIDVWRK